MRQSNTFYRSFVDFAVFINGNSAQSNNKPALPPANDTRPSRTVSRHSSVPKRCNILRSRKICTSTVRSSMNTWSPQNHIEQLCTAISFVTVGHKNLSNLYSVLPIFSTRPSLGQGVVVPLSRQPLNSITCSTCCGAAQTVLIRASSSFGLNGLVM